MRAFGFCVLTGLCFCTLACGSTEESTNGSGGTSSGGTSSGGTSSGGASSGGTSGASNDAGSDAPANDPTGCEKAGGQCGCAGGCQPGFHAAAGPLLSQCPQPCDGCGACSQECCLPDDAGAINPCGPGGVCIAPSASCPLGLTMTAKGCELAGSSQLGSCCIDQDAG